MMKIARTTQALMAFVLMMMIFSGTSCSLFGSDDEIVIGLPYKGGIVGYIYVQGDPGYVAGETHGIIVAPYDNANNIHWATTEDATGAVEVALGKGLFNTQQIITYHGSDPSAANVCDDLKIDDYSDWYLPSKDELEKIWENHQTIGGFDVNAHYWTSSESFQDYKNAGVVNFYAGNFGYHLKTSQNHHVRAIRYF
ncbi:MAG: DUF1566 domain-containing protein [Bacteroidales bacterium]